MAALKLEYGVVPTDEHIYEADFPHPTSTWPFPGGWHMEDR